MPATTVLVCVVVLVSSGDSLTVQCGGTQAAHAVSVHGIAAPEDDQPFAMESRLHLRSMCGKVQVSVTLHGKGRAGEVVADVRCGHHDVATEQVRAGLAWHDEDYDDGHEDLQVAQSEAIAAGREIWATARPVAPWKWKRKASGHPRSAK